jgi:hypothetical protein
MKGHRYKGIRFGHTQHSLQLLLPRDICLAALQLQAQGGILRLQLFVV